MRVYMRCCARSGSSSWEEPGDVTAYKQANPDLFVDGFDEHVLCATASNEAAFAQFDLDPSTNPDYVGVCCMPRAL